MKVRMREPRFGLGLKSNLSGGRFQCVKSKTSARAERFDDVRMKPTSRACHLPWSRPYAVKATMVIVRPRAGTRPGVWYRYTLDGTIPTRTRGYIYWEIITSQPGMTIKAVAYKCDFGDNRNVEAADPPANPK
jgi:hypothetical protein